MVFERLNGITVRDTFSCGKRAGNEVCRRKVVRRAVDRIINR